MDSGAAGTGDAEREAEGVEQADTGAEATGDGDWDGDRDSYHSPRKSQQRDWTMGGRSAGTKRTRAGTSLPENVTTWQAGERPVETVAEKESCEARLKTIGAQRERMMLEA